MNMKKLFYILLFLFPVVVFPQQPWYKFSPLNYVWSDVGNADFSAGTAKYTSLALNPVNDQPCMAYSDWANSEYASVMEFNGTNWRYVGSPAFSADGAWYTSIAFNSSGQPYVAYSDEGNSWGATVMKFDGTTWDYVGSAAFSTGQANYTNL